VNEEITSSNNSQLDLAASQLAEILVQQIDEESVRRRKKKSPAPSELPKGN
jgi:hypothetical protein